MSNPHLNTAHSIGAKQAQEDVYKTAYTQGVQKAMEDLGFDKTATDDTLAAILGATPFVGDLASGIYAGQTAPEGRGVSRGFSTGIGTGIGAILSSALARRAGLAGVPRTLVSLLGGSAGASGGLAFSRSGDSTWDKIRESLG